MKIIQRIFSKKKKLTAGGLGRCDVCDGLGRTVAKMWYRRPDGNMKFDYIYNCQEKILTESQIKEIAKDNTERRTSEIIARDLFIPYAEQIFEKSEGYDDNGKCVDKYSREEQFEYLKKNWPHHLIQMVSLAYNDETSIKKNS